MPGHVVDFGHGKKEKAVGKLPLSNLLFILFIILGRNH